MLPHHITQEIREKIEQDFPPGKQLKAERILLHYLKEDLCPDIDMVRLGILKLAQGKLWLLAHYVRAARYDYRDILYWAYARNQDE
ncbi:MAG: hypothetical protein GY801_46545 [bacterium]|nr:hypothetical protein [bacterium]